MSVGGLISARVGVAEKNVVVIASHARQGARSDKHRDAKL